MELKRVNAMSFIPFFRLLIVPYGIETYKDNQYTLYLLPFNRTLWN